MDFFNLEKPDVDFIISNPPFSKRDKVLEKLYEWDIPFAMIFSANGLFDGKIRFNLVKKYGAEVIYMYPRVKFIEEDGDRQSPPFQSVYWCYKMLPEKMIFCDVEEKNE